MSNKFIFREEVVIRPKNGVLDISDVSNLDDFSALWKSGIKNQQDLVGRLGVIDCMSHDNEDIDEIGHKATGRWTYGVLIDVVNEKEMEFDERLYFFRETDLESTGVIRENPETEPREVIRVRVDPKTGEGFIVEDDH